MNECLLVILSSLISELQHALLHTKCYKPGSVLQLYTFALFSPQTHIQVYQGAWECVIFSLGGGGIWDFNFESNKAT